MDYLAVARRYGIRPESLSPIPQTEFLGPYFGKILREVTRADRAQWAEWGFDFKAREEADEVSFKKEEKKKEMEPILVARKLLYDSKSWSHDAFNALKRGSPSLPGAESVKTMVNFVQKVLQSSLSQNPVKIAWVSFDFRRCVFLFCFFNIRMILILQIGCAGDMDFVALFLQDIALMLSDVEFEVILNDSGWLVSFGA